MKRIKNGLLTLFEPSAFKVGIVISIAFVYLALNYYLIPKAELEQHPILALIHQAHQKSIDFRMRMRGEREGSDELVLLAIDEPSLETIGRWPWPRTKIADIIERLMSYDAKVIAFDAVFAEPENNQTLQALHAIRDSEFTNAPLKKIINREIESANSDMILAKTVAKYSDRLVMGAYFDPPEGNYSLLQQLCSAFIDSTTPEYFYLENEDRPIILLEESIAEIPKQIIEASKNDLQKIESDLKQKVDDSHLTIHQKLDLRNNITAAKIKYCENWLHDGLIHNVFDNYLNRTGRWWLNIPPIAQGTKHTGYFNAFPDSDGTMRFSNLVVRYGKLTLSSLALKTSMLARNWSAIATVDINPHDPTTKRVRDITLTDNESGESVYTIPTDEQGRLAIDYSGPRYSYAHLSAGELFNGKETAYITKRINGADKSIQIKKTDYLKDKIFLFGATATAIYDLRVTPFQENFPGPEIHLNIIDNLLNKKFLRTSGGEENKMVAALAVLGIVFSGTIAYLGAVIGLLITLIALAAIALIDKVFLFESGHVATVILPLFLIVTLYTALTFYKYLTEERKKKELKGTFQKYVSPAVVEEILKHPENLNLGGKKQKLTVMFSDVRGFTTISEKLEPIKLSEVLNRYLTPMTKLVFENKGTLDKYMGDAIMAFWGAPIAFNDHAKHTCRCALQMMQKLKDINEELTSHNLPQIDIGIGINTGEMSVGNMGSDIVRSYTVMGDSVNLGSRLEGLNKEYGTHIIISEYTYHEVKDGFICREIDWVRVKGKHRPVRIYELVGEKLTVTPATLERIQNFNNGLEAYHQQNWTQAVTYFEKCISIDPNDQASKVYLKRCSSYQQTPPPAQWDGVYEMKTK